MNGFRFTRFLFLAIILLTGCNVESREIDAPEGLICELLRYPEKAVITDSSPEFGWIFPAGDKKQSSYRILVASSPELLDEGKADMWDSRKVKCEKSINVEYKGKPLSENSSYWWKVKVWDEERGESAYSLPQQFYTGLFKSTDNYWPGKSNYVKLPDGTWVSENRQTAEFQKKEPVQFEKVKPGRWFADFGKAAFGTLELVVSSEKDSQKLEVYLGERKNDDLTVNKKPGRSNIGYEKLEVVLEKGTHTYNVEIPTHHSGSPHTQKLAPFYPEVLPFRYVEVNGKKNKVDVRELTQLTLYYPFDDNASAFKSSDENLNKVWELCKYTLKGTPFLGLYADGNRERMPYEADAYIQQLGHTCVDREFSVARYTTDFLIYHSSWPTEWQIHSVLMAWEDYMQTGNSELLEARYDELKAKTLIALAEDNGLISTRTGKVTPEFLESIHFNGQSIRDITDWPTGTPKGKKQAGNAGPTPEGERDGFVFTDFNTIVNAFHYRSLVLMSKIAEVLGKKEDVEFYSNRAEKVKGIMLEKMIDPKRGIFTDGIGTDHASLHANMFPLAFGLVPDKYMNSVVEFIKSRGMACSVYGAQHLLDALFNAGEAEYALSLMTSESKRSWLNMIRVGSTMTTEAWDEYYKPNLTWNHAWGSAPANIIPRRLIGIEPLEAGFGRFRIVPQPADLKEAALKLPTIRGTVNMNLVNSDNSWQMEITVPGNSEAELWLPASFENVLINQERCKPVRSVTYAGEKRDVFLISAGRWSVTAK